MKFLPFIVEKSTPIHIYQTLLSRSKGMNNILIASVFYLVLNKGIVAVRKDADPMPEMPLEKLYAHLLNIYPQYSVSNEFFKRIQAVGPYIKLAGKKGDIPEEMDNYSLTDTMSFLLALLLSEKLEDYSKLNLKALFDDNSDEALSNLSAHNLFSNTGDVVEFSSQDDVEAYIHYHVLISSSVPDPVCAVLIDSKARKRTGSSKRSYAEAQADGDE